jgi:thioredoxin 1
MYTGIPAEKCRDGCRDAIIYSKGLEHFQELLRECRLVVAVVSSPTCTACMFYVPVFQDYASRNRYGKVAYVIVDAYEDPETAFALGAMATPTTYVFYKGDLVDGFVGAVGSEELEEFLGKWIRKALSEG